MTNLHLFPALVLPSPITVSHEMMTLLTSGYGGKTLIQDIGISTIRITLGFIGAVVVGVPIGILMASSQIVFRAFDPILQFVRPVPPLAYIPLMVVWFGIGELSKITVILLGTIPVIIISAMSGVKNVPPQRIHVAECLGASRFQVFWHVILPSALPDIFTGMRVGIGVAWTCLVAAEIIAATAGLGWLVQEAGQALNVSAIFVGIVAIGILGYLMELIIRSVEKLAVPWKGH
ncbi:MAG: ABC transporter permease [Sulfobacillus thermotolerans]|nr:ABC transporter permease [Sulfobacillus thermotolerans]